MKSSRGFTLIELMVVLVILSLLLTATFSTEAAEPSLAIVRAESLDAVTQDLSRLTPLRLSIRETVASDILMS